VRKKIAAVLQVLVYLVAVFAVLALAVIPSQILLGDLEALGNRLQILLLGVQVLLAVIVVNLFLARVRRSELVRAGWPALRRGARWFGIGLLMGVLLGGGVLVITGLFGGGRLQFTGGGWSTYLRYVLPLLGCLLIAALAEEWAFRGYPLAKLSPVVGRGWANVIVAVLFTAGHWGGDGWTVLAAGNIFLFSLVNGAMRFTPGGIPAAWGFHFAWNGLYVLLGANLSGTDFEVPLLRFADAGPAWLSGGAYGPEGAIGTTVVTVAGLVVIRKLWLRGDSLARS
jgi:membrane protease YdiL (CAAX protease family)